MLSNATKLSVNLDCLDQIDLSFQELKKEAEALFSLLDNVSKKITGLEKNLSALSANFPFRSLVKKEDLSMTAPLRDDVYNNVVLPGSRSCIGYRNQMCWYLSWESMNENSKMFRLFLVSIEKEIPVWTSSDTVINDLIPIEQLRSKKALIETDLATRLKFSEYLIRFLFDFKNYLNKYRKSLENPVLDQVEGAKETLFDPFADLLF